MARFIPQSRNGVTIAPLTSHAKPTDLLRSIQNVSAGLTLAQLLERHTTVAHRTAQRWLGQWVGVRLMFLAKFASTPYAASAGSYQIRTAATTGYWLRSFSCSQTLISDW